METGLIFNIIHVIPPSKILLDCPGFKILELNDKNAEISSNNKMCCVFFQKQEQSDEYGNVTYSERKRFIQVFGQK